LATKEKLQTCSTDGSKENTLLRFADTDYSEVLVSHYCRIYT